MRGARSGLALVAMAVLGVTLSASAKPAPKRKAQTHKPAPSAPAPAPAPRPSPGGDNPDDSGGNGDSVLAASDPLPDAKPPAPAAAPEPAPPPPVEPEKQEKKDKKEAPPPASGGTVDLQKLRADYDRLRDELYRARARAQIVQEGLYASRLAATVRWKGSPDYVIRRAELRLDGASLWDSGDKPVTDDLIKVAERPVKPGPHALTVRLEIRPGAIAKAQKAGGKEAEQYGYTSEHTFAINVPDGKRTTVAITGDEDGDPPEYEPEIEVELETEK
jgi:hypothetical protein